MDVVGRIGFLCQILLLALRSVEVSFPLCTIWMAKATTKAAVLVGMAMHGKKLQWII